jgi:hypothetical protein
MDKDFSFLLHPGKLPSSYQAALSEVSRRREFHRQFELEIANLNQFIDRERERR